MIELKKLKKNILYFVLFLLLYSGIYLISFLKKPKEQFIELYLTNQNDTATFSNFRNIPLNKKMEWKIGIKNNMEDNIYIKALVKHTNYVDYKHLIIDNIPPNWSILYEKRILLLTNESLELAFNWSVITVLHVNNSVELVFNINNKDIHASSTYAEPMINNLIRIEIWTYDVEKETFIFGWNNNNHIEQAWLQYWFDLSL